MTESPDLPDLPIGPTAHYLHYKLLDIQELISTSHDNLTQIQAEIKDLTAITKYLAGIDICKINPNYDPIRNFLEAERQTHNNPIIFDCPILDANKYQVFTLTADDIPVTEEPPTNTEVQDATSEVNTHVESETRSTRFRRSFAIIAQNRTHNKCGPKRHFIWI